MFAEIMVKEPLEKIADDWDFLNEKILKHYSTFKGAGDNILGLRRRVISRDAVTDSKKGNIGLSLELGPKGIVPFRHRPLSIRVTTAGTPHHVPHNFGYWHINDKDELYLQLPAAVPGEPGHAIVIMGSPRENETDSFAWYCEKCLTLLYDHVVETGRCGFDGFWKGEATAVRTYNSDVNLRTCPECNHVNPAGYCWNSAKDSPEEAAARKQW
jgi:hypothetical protein